MRAEPHAQSSEGELADRVRRNDFLRRVSPDLDAIERQIAMGQKSIRGGLAVAALLVRDRIAEIEEEAAAALEARTAAETTEASE